MQSHGRGADGCTSTADAAAVKVVSRVVASIQSLRPIALESVASGFQPSNLSYKVKIPEVSKFAFNVCIPLSRYDTGPAEAVVRWETEYIPTKLRWLWDLGQAWPGVEVTTVGLYTLNEVDP
jgi:hypothetical protein